MLYFWEDDDVAVGKMINLASLLVLQNLGFGLNKSDATPNVSVSRQEHCDLRAERVQLQYFLVSWEQQWLRFSGGNVRWDADLRLMGILQQMQKVIGLGTSQEY